MVFLIDKQIPIGQSAKMFQTGQAVLIERALQVGQGGRSRIDKAFQIDKAGLTGQDLPIDKAGLTGQELLIDKAGLIDKVLLIDQGGRIGMEFRIDKAGHIDREISIGAVRN